MFKKYINDQESKKLVAVLSLAGIIIATFIMLLLNFTAVKNIVVGFLGVLMPFIWGVLFALICSKTAIKLEKALPEKWELKTRRFIGALVSVLILILVVVILIIVIAPRLIESITSLTSRIAKFASDPDSFDNFINDSFSIPAGLVSLTSDLSTKIFTSLANSLKAILPNVVSSTVTAVSSVVDFILGFIVCLYILIDRQRMAVSFKKFFSVLLTEDQYKKGKKVMYLSIDKFTGFFSGKLIDSAIIGVLCFVIMLFIDKEYALLIAFIIGITNIIPFFGPFIGAIPCALLLLIVKPIESLIFIVAIILLQQVDGNIIGPKILGDSVGLSSLWIMFSILVGGAYFGFFGMLLGVPVFAVIYYVIKEFVDEQLAEQELKEEKQKKVTKKKTSSK